MKLQGNIAGALLLLAACSEDHSGDTPRSKVESSHAALGTVPASEIATWTQIAAPPASPDATFLQSAAFDETRKVVMMFGGFNQPDPAMPLQASPDLWEWDPATGLWTNRRPTPPGDKPYRRAGAGMVFDSLRNKLVLFGGRTTAISNYADIFDWDPTTGLFTDRTNLTGGPQARSQHGMVFEKSTGKVLLFGGGVAAGDSLDSADQTLVSVALGDTWEWDPATGKWTQLQPTSAPSARYDSALVWDSIRNRAVLFGGMEQPQAGLNGVPKQDTWEWDPATQAWTNRTTAGQKPSPRYGHCMAFDPARGVTVLVGGWDIDTGDDLADVWEWEPIAGAWTQRLTGSEPNLPAARMFASLVTDSARNRLELMGGQLSSDTAPPTMEIWELEPTAAAFTDRAPSSPKGWPPPRSGPAMAFCPATGKTYVFGGQDNSGVSLDDLWEWDGTTWSEVASDVRPSGRMDAAMAYDPFRKSLILFGGSIPLPPSNIPTSNGSEFLSDTWEWNSGTRKWTQLLPASSPEPRDSHGMVTDSGRAKVLLFGGETYAHEPTYPIPGQGSSSGGGIDMPDAVWEWDGANTTWTNRTPAPLASSPSGSLFPPLSFDDGRQKMFLLFDVSGVSGDTSPGEFWEWDPVSAGWSLRDTGDIISGRDSFYIGVTYDSLRRRQILARGPNGGSQIETWELDTRAPTLYQRVLASAPNEAYGGSTMAFDSQRGVVVFFGGGSGPTNETWEYKVTSLGNGEGCTAAKASTCASGFCVDTVCCSTASCSGSCQSCNVAGHEGICTRADPGTEVPGSCADGQACDGSGKCNTKNGIACTSAAACASGFCVDGVCCESACGDICLACNQTGRAGKCSPYVAGSDPENECGQGSDPCRPFCDGAGSCDSAPFGTPCGPCALCDGNGTCAPPDPASCGPSDAGAGGSGGTGGTSAGGAGGTSGGGAGGISTGGAGGAGGSLVGGRGGAGGSSSFGGSGAGGAGGISSSGGFAGSVAGSSGGTTTGGAGGRGGPGGTVTGDAGSFGGATTVGDAGGAVALGGAGGSVSGGISGLGGAPAAGGSPDGGQYPIPPDAGRPDGGNNSISPDAGNPAELHRSGCNCDLGQSGPRAPGLPFALLGAAFLSRRLRRRPLRGSGVLIGAAILLLTTCSQNDPGNVASLESSHRALGTVPATESATWTRVGAPTSPTPNPRYMQSAAFDETRKVLVMFGGRSDATDGGEYGAATQDLWEWDPATGKWTDRTPTGNKPSKRAGAGMVFDSSRNKFIIFGGRATTGYDYEDIWEWDPVDGGFLDRTDSGTAPGGRSQHSMVFEESTSTVLLFGGGLADSGSSIWPEKFSYSDPTQRPGSGVSYDGTGVSRAFADTWEWNPVTGKWTQLAPATAPSARYDSALVWDSKRSRAVLFGGMQKADANADGVPQRDIWEWDPAAASWTLRAATGSMPSARWGHAMAYDPGRGMTVVVGGKDLQTHLGLADVWDWNPTTGAWAQRLTGSESNLPQGRMYASLVTDSGQNHLDLVAGITFFGAWDEFNPPDPGTQVTPSAELWELDPVSAAFTSRSAPLISPGNRWGHTMAFCPATGKTYVFGGANDQNPLLDDLWEWDGSAWSQVQSDVRPPGRVNPAMAYDPVRKSLILFSGESGTDDQTGQPALFTDTWEWNSTTRKWSQLAPTSSPGPQDGAGMVTDLGRGKVLLLTEDASNTVWEWDGSKANWTNRTPVPGTVTPPNAPWIQVLTFDEGRQKMFFFQGQSNWTGTTSNSVYWEWNPISTGWAFHDSGDFVDFGTAPLPVIAYDSLRRRQVVATNATTTTGATTSIKTWELDTKNATWYRRDLSTGPTSLTSAAMAFDSQRGVMVLFGAGPYDGSDQSETWEYKVTSLGNGEGCTAATATSCASGFCVEGVCCAVASCSGVCQSCAVAGHEGTCSQAAAGTEITGSCADGQACDASGSCKAKNGTVCSSAGVCASGFCVDGVCCESACAGRCLSCNQAGLAGQCAPYALGSDPEKECGLGSGLCRSTCNGAGACDYPQYGSICGSCQICDGSGLCFDADPSECSTGGSGGGGESGGAGGTGGIGGAGGAGGSIIIGGAGGSIVGGVGGVGGSIFGGVGGGAGAGGSIVGGVGGRGGAGGVGGFLSGDAGGTGFGGVGGAGGILFGGRGGTGGPGGTGGAINGGAGGTLFGGVGGGGGAPGSSGNSGISPDGGLILPDAASPDGGPIQPDAASPDGRRPAPPPDAASTTQPRRQGCSCDLGQTAAGPPGLPFALLGVALLWRRLRRSR